MKRVVLDTNVIVSAVLAPSGTQASVLLLALTGRIALYVSPSVLAEYEEVLRRPRLKLQPHQISYNRPRPFPFRPTNPTIGSWNALKPPKRTGSLPATPGTFRQATARRGPSLAADFSTF
jgi:hypothetical protein